MTLDEAIGDMRAAHETDMDLLINSDDLKDVIGYLEELKKQRKQVELREIVEAVDSEVKQTHCLEFKCELGHLHMGMLNINGLKMEVYAGALTGCVISDHNGIKSIKHRLTLIEM